MRGDVFNINECEITYTVQYDEPDHQGTVALGYVLWQDALYNYREVRWTAKQCEQANIVANKAGGSFDFDVLANEFEQVDLLEWGFEPFELGIEDMPNFLPTDGSEQPRLDQKSPITCPHCNMEFIPK